MKNQVLNEAFWSEKYQSGDMGWDIGAVSPPIQGYIDQLNDKKLSILIPGAGNAYEAAYLFEQGFKNITVVDIAKEPLKNLKNRIPEFPERQLIQQDFFEHKGQYDLIIEQTFFCALDPSLRVSYIDKMQSLLKPGGKLVGLLFDFRLDSVSPPFGGTKDAYTIDFEKHFKFNTFEPCFNSIKPRQGRELFIIFEKKN